MSRLVYLEDDEPGGTEGRPYDWLPDSLLRQALTHPGVLMMLLRTCPGTTCLLNSMDHQHVANWGAER